MDFILNGQGHGSVAEKLLANNMDPNCLKPWIGDDGRAYINKVVENGKVIAMPVQNVTATLRKDDWKQMDEAVIRASKAPMRVFGDLRAAGLTYTIPNGMGKTVLEYEDESDISDATMSMDGLRQGDSDRPLYDLKSLPLPIVHKDFHFSARQIMTSRNGGSPLDTTTAELAATKVAEKVEKLTLGVDPSYSSAGATVYGYTNLPDRLTKVITAPTTSNQATVVAEVLAMRQQAYDAFHFGPNFILYNSPLWDQFLDTDYSSSKGDNTLRDRLLKIDGITKVATAHHLTGTQLILVQMSANVARAVIGMEITTVQWESHGGMQLNFKVMAILVPQLRADQNGNTGIVHGNIA